MSQNHRPELIPDLQIEVVYAMPDAEQVVALSLPATATVAEALAAARDNPVIGALTLSAHAVGVWGQVVALETVLQHGDRVEIYRPLQVDAKTARRRRAERQQKT